MKANIKRLFSLSALDSDYFNNKQDKIELLSCPRKEMICKEHLSVVNKCYIESEHYQREKDYTRSIETLKSAFHKTTELVESPCNRCAAIFRTTITESMENLQGELEKMSTGIFGKKRYQSCCIMADKVLSEFENFKLSNTIQLKDTKERFFGKYLNRRVS